MKFKLIVVAVFGFLTSVSAQKTVLEVTSFKIKPAANAATFNALDAQVENNFTKNQAGFIKRQSGLNENGEYVVLVYWKSIKDATASMNKFMTDAAVAEYASMIDGASMKMERYSIRVPFKANASTFVEVMSFDTKKGTNSKAFHKINHKVETGFTAKQKGFLQRIIGFDANRKQVVVVYWDNKANSDAAFQPFLQNDIAKEFMSKMEQSSVQMGRYQTLNSIQ